VGQEEPTTSREILTITSRDAAAFLVDPKDQGLLDVARLLGARLGELSEEFDEVNLPPGAASVIARLITGAGSITIHAASESAEDATFPFLARLDLPETDPQSARALAAEIARLLGTAGMDVELPEQGGMVELPVPIPIFLGDADGRCVISLGAPDGPAGPVRPARVELAGGVEPVMTFVLDYGAFLESGMQWISGMGAGSELEPMTHMLEAMGVSDLHIESALGVAADRMIGELRMRGYAATMRKMGILPEQFLSGEVLRVIPEDAIWAQVSIVDMAGYVDWMLELMEDQIASAGMDDPIETLEEMTGFHLYRDVLDHLGHAWGAYQSDTTGGSGILSMVCFAELTDPAAMEETGGRIAETLNGIAQNQAQGYVQVRHWNHQDVRYATLTFPGLPVPFEPTVAIAGNFLILGVTPQAALGATHQVQHGSRSLVDNPRFQEQAPAKKDGVNGISFLDTPRYLRSGYMPASLLSSALANAVRSRSDASRDPGLVLPPFHELALGAKAMLTVSYVQGDDIVQHSFLDHSFMVNMVGLAGYVIDGPILPLMGLGAAGGVRAEQEKRSAQMEVIGEDESGEF
jgi:hypothetical protein